jgi:hypothetical protein
MAKGNPMERGSGEWTLHHLPHFNNHISYHRKLQQSLGPHRHLYRHTQ